MRRNYLTVPDIVPDRHAMSKLSHSGPIGEVCYRKLGGTYQRQDHESDAVLSRCSTWSRGVELRLRPSGFRSASVPGAARCARRVQGHHPLDPDPRALLGPQRVQTVRPGKPSAAELPDGRLERRHGLPRSSPASTSSSTNSTTRAWNSAAGSTPPRTPASSAETFHRMYPRIDEWIAVRRKADPERRVRLRYGPTPRASLDGSAPTDRRHR